MLFTRKIGKIVRGKATPFQIIAACVLGAIIGFTPSFTQAPGLVIALVLAVMLINANLAAAGLVAMISKLLSLLLMPVSFKVGQVLLDGPTQGMFASAINAPVLAFLGLEYYATTGGIAVAIVFGLLVGILLSVFLTKLRRKLSSLEEGSEMYKKVTGFFLTRVVLFIFVGGGKGKKKSWDDVASKKIGNPIRMLGVVFAVLVIGLLFVVRMIFADQIVLAQLRTSLETVNGATVDVKNASIDLSEGRMLVEGLALADPNKLETDLFRAIKLEADISATDLMRKRISFDQIVATGVSTGKKRQRPGIRLQPRRAPVEPPKPKEGEQDLDYYLTQADVWKKRLEQINHWLEKLSSESEEEKPEAKKDEKLSDWLEREIERVGYRRVAATHLIEGSPTLLVRKFVAGKVEAPSILAKGQTMDIELLNISSHPNLVQDPPAITVTSSDKALDLALKLNQATAAGGDNSIHFVYKGLETDRMASQIKVGDKPPIAGGTMDVSLIGKFRVGSGGFIDLPMPITFHNVSFFGLQKINKPLEFPIGLRGRLIAPYITVDMKKLADNAAKAGLNALASEARDRAQREIDKQVDVAKAKAQEEIDKAKKKLTDKIGEAVGKELGKEVGDKVPGVDGILKGVLGGKKKDGEKGGDSKSGTKKEPIKDAVGGALKGLLGGKKKDEDKKSESKDDGKQSDAGKEEKDPGKDAVNKAIGGALDSLLGGKKKKEEEKNSDAEDEKNKQSDAGEDDKKDPGKEAIDKAIGGALDSLFGGKKKK